MAEPTPIGAHAVLETDAEREMVDYLVCRIKTHLAEFSEPPDTIAIVTESDRGRIPHSFSLRRKYDRLATCSAAAACLLKRGMED